MRLLVFVLLVLAAPAAAQSDLMATEVLPDTLLALGAWTYADTEPVDGAAVHDVRIEIYREPVLGLVAHVTVGPGPLDVRHVAVARVDVFGRSRTIATLVPPSPQNDR